MVKPREAVELDPTPEDILSVWGKEIIAQNIDKFFGSAGSHATEKFTSEGSWINRAPKGLLEESLELAGLNSQGVRGLPKPSFQEEGFYLTGKPYVSQVSKEKPYSPAPFLSGGLEDTEMDGCRCGRVGERRKRGAR